MSERECLCASSREYLLTPCRYKLAEKLSERLDEMGKDLSSMIEEVNNASATLSKTNKADEPVCSLFYNRGLLFPTNS